MLMIMFALSVINVKSAQSLLCTLGNLRLGSVTDSASLAGRSTSCNDVVKQDIGKLSGNVHGVNVGNQ